MDKNRTFVEITNIFCAKESEKNTHAQRMEKLSKALDDFKHYQYTLGVRNGMFKAINMLTEQAESIKP